MNGSCYRTKCNDFVSLNLWSFKTNDTIFIFKMSQRDRRSRTVEKLSYIWKMVFLFAQSIRVHLDSIKTAGNACKGCCHLNLVTCQLADWSLIGLMLFPYSWWPLLIRGAILSFWDFCRRSKLWSKFLLCWRARRRSLLKSVDTVFCHWLVSISLNSTS